MKKKIAKRAKPGVTGNKAEMPSDAETTPSSPAKTSRGRRNGENEPPLQPSPEYVLSSRSRPTRKRTSVNYRELNERGIQKWQKDEGTDDEDEVDDEDDVDAANDIAEVLDSDFSSSLAKNSFNSGEEEEVEEVEFTLPHRKFGKRRIAFNPVLPSKKRSKVETVTYETCKDQICVVCARELEIGSLDGLANIFTDLTSNGKSLHELLRTLVRQDVQPTFFGSRVCSRCLSALNGIEHHYLQYRRAVDSFMDTFATGQKSLDADVIGAEDLQGQMGLMSFVDLSKATVKLIDPTCPSFNALAIGHDFQVPVDKIFRVSIVPETEIPPESEHEENEDGIITITYDQTTGRIEKTTDLGPAEVTEHEVDQSKPQLYLSPEDFDSLKKSVTKNTLYLSREELDKICSRLLLGQRIRQQFILSKTVAEEYQRQIPGVQAKFTCSDCSISFAYLHMLSNHIQSVHVSEDSTGEQGMTVRGSNDKGECIRTGEVATLEKPFQCEYCDKCFSEYLTLSTHIDHYHGFSRTCNIENCSEVITSIQEFVQHYVTHADANFKVPTDFQAKTKVLIPCPLCNISIQGVWKYFQHTYTHEKEARFKCPVCGKRTHKVQNFKDHLIKHNRGSSGSNKGRSGEGSNGEAAAAFSCRCGKTFSVLHKLTFHQEVHMPKDLWSFTCSSCGSSFPSESRLKLHVANIHSNANSQCSLCDQVFLNRHSLQVHVKEEHSADSSGEQPHPVQTESIIIIQQ